MFSADTHPIDFSVMVAGLISLKMEIPLAFLAQTLLYCQEDYHPSCNADNLLRRYKCPSYLHFLQ